jgi:hypothetical protein
LRSKAFILPNAERLGIGIVIVILQVFSYIERVS